jgi:hypothetical protein
LDAAFSKELKDYSWDLIENSIESDFLRENVSPITYMKVINWNNEDKNLEFKADIKDAKVNGLSVVRVMTFMHQDESAWDSLSSPLIKNIAYYVRKVFGMNNESYTPGLAAVGASNLEAVLGKAYIPEASIKSWYLRYFPPGSVMICVTINFQMEYQSLISDKVVSEDKSSVQYKPRSSSSLKLSVPASALYLGCVSGQKELEWKLVRLDVKFDTSTT